MVTGSDNITRAMSTVIPKIRESPNAQNSLYINMECDQVIKQLFALDTHYTLHTLHYREE